MRGFFSPPFNLPTLYTQIATDPARKSTRGFSTPVPRPYLIIHKLGGREGEGVGKVEGVCGGGGEGGGGKLISERQVPLTDYYSIASTQ